MSSATRVCRGTCSYSTNAEDLRTFFLCKSMTASVFLFCGAVSSFNFDVFLHRMCTSVCQCTCVYMHMCSDRHGQFAITINLSCNFCKTDVCRFNFFSLFFFFFFFLLTTAYSCVKVFVSTVVAGSLVMHHLLGSVMYSLFSRMVASSHWRAFSVVSRSSDTQYHLVAATVFFFSAAHYTASVFLHPCIHNIHRARVNIRG